MAVLFQRYDAEGKPERSFEYIFLTLSAADLAKKPGDPVVIGDREYTVISIREDFEDERFDELVDLFEVKKKADQ